MKITKYTVETEKEGLDLRAAVVSDLHGRPYRKVIDALKAIAPDLILLPGDIFEIAVPHMTDRNRNALSFFREAVKLAPCYYCYGNHELYHSYERKGRPHRSDPRLLAERERALSKCGVNLLNDRAIAPSERIAIAGMVCGREMDANLNSPRPNTEVITELTALAGFRILLCHYPHYYEKYLKDTGIDLILSGHAHGGQWRLFGRGLYAPHQGILPKHTSGIEDGRHIISRGAVNNAKPIPRLFNPCEVLEIRIVSKSK